MISFSNYLYDHPEFYDKVFPDRTSSSFCTRAVQRYALGARSILDLGCGTGSTLEALAQVLPDRTGVDLTEPMVRWGRHIRPELDLRVGDMTHLDLGRTYDVIGCFGWAFSYLLDDADLVAGLACMSRHAHAGSLLTFDCGQANYYLDLPELPILKNNYDLPGFKASHEANFQLDRDSLVLTRHRQWSLPGNIKAQDLCQYRLHSPEGLSSMLRQASFEVLEILGDPSGQLQAPGERTLHVVAKKIGER
jgi:SAM-dependent methyltransferase